MNIVKQPKKPDTRPPLHTVTEEELFTFLGSSRTVLTTPQAEAALTHYGHNDISHIRKSPVIVQYLGHFKNLLVIILLIAAAISLFVGEIINTEIIVIIVLASVTLNFFQEYKAGNGAEFLKQKLVSKAIVLRDGVRTELPVNSLVPGDLVFLAAGDLVPADGRILDERDFFVNQSALTSEPFPVGKTAGREEPEKALAEAGIKKGYQMTALSVTFRYRGSPDRTSGNAV